MSDRIGAALLARALDNVANMPGSTKRCRRKAALAVWTAAAGCDFGDWDVVDDLEVTEGTLRGLGLLRGPRDSEVFVDRRTGKFPEAKLLKVVRP